MKIKVVKCKSCESVITSRANHDFNSCKCGSVSVDGGWYDEDTDTQLFTRIIGAFQREHVSTIELPISPADLRNDWNKQIDEYKDLTKYA